MLGGLSKGFQRYEKKKTNYSKRKRFVGFWGATYCNPKPKQISSILCEQQQKIQLLVRGILFLFFL